MAIHSRGGEMLFNLCALAQKMFVKAHWVESLGLRGISIQNLPSPSLSKRVGIDLLEFIKQSIHKVGMRVQRGMMPIKLLRRNMVQSPKNPLLNSGSLFTNKWHLFRTTPISSASAPDAKPTTHTTGNIRRRIAQGSMQNAERGVGAHH